MHQYRKGIRKKDRKGKEKERKIEEATREKEGEEKKAKFEVERGGPLQPL